MTGAQLAHTFPDLTEAQALLALLSETLEMARDMETTQSDLEPFRNPSCGTMNHPLHNAYVARAYEFILIDIIRLRKEHEV